MKNRKFIRLTRPTEREGQKDRAQLPIRRLHWAGRADFSKLQRNDVRADRRAGRSGEGKGVLREQVPMLHPA